REAVRLVANPLDEQQRRIVLRQRDRILAVARVEELFLFGDPDRNEVGEAELLEGGVGGRQLTFAAVDQNEIGKRAAELEQLAIAPLHDFVHRREVVLDARIAGSVGAQGSELGAGCRRSGGWSLGTAGFERQSALLTASPWPQAASSAPDAELPVLAFAHPAVFAHDHRRHRLAALDRRDVEALDAARQRRQREY